MTRAVPLFDPEGAQAIDRDAVDSLQLSAGDLMERAGAAAWRLLQAHWPGAGSIGILAGVGNNGGDGYVLARLARQAGLEVRVLATAEPRADDARIAFQRWREAGGRDSPAAPDTLPTVDVWVDGLLGIGLRDAVGGELAGLIGAVNASATPVLALDLPSGVNAATGEAPGAAIQAALSVQFIVAKTGLYTGAGRRLAGMRVLEALAVPDTLVAPHAPAAQALGREALAPWCPPRRRDAHKGHHGRVVCLGGDHGMGGAVRLCAEAALRVGAGLVAVGTRAAHVAAILAARPEVMVHAVDAEPELEALLASADVLALGPGLGTQEWGRALWRAGLATGRPCVIDADALNLLASGQRAVSERAVLTPHPGEAARLLGCTAAEVNADRIAAAQSIAARFDSVVVLKGAGTVVARQGEVPCVIDAGNPGMAVGGMGDVLTGVIAGLMAQGLDPWDAARAGALVHAMAADDAAGHGERGLLPLDLMPHLRRLVNPKDMFAL